MQKVFVIVIVLAALLAAETGYLGIVSQQAAGNMHYYDAPKATADAAADATASAASLLAQKAAPKGSGSFELEYAVPDSSLSDIYEAVRQAGVFDGMIYQLNSNFILPTNIAVVFAQCGNPAASYDPQQKKVEICYELIKDMRNLYAFTNATGNATDAAISNAEFVLYHEIGHALIDTLNIPVTGKEEDASDQLATLLVMGNGQNNDVPVVLTAYALNVRSSYQDPNAVQLWDEHSLDSQRFYNILCWLYGNNPLRYQSLAFQFMPAERTQRCGGEYAKMADSWQRLLQLYFKSG